MNGQTTQWVFNLILWVVIEIILNIVGIDDLANYSEFLFEQPVHVEVIANQSISIDRYHN
jgi:hypothetical protein